MQNHIPTAYLQALVPEFTARGQWFCKYLSLQKITSKGTNQTTDGISKYPIYTFHKECNKIKIPVKRNE